MARLAKKHQDKRDDYAMKIKACMKKHERLEQVMPDRLAAIRAATGN